MSKHLVNEETKEIFRTRAIVDVIFSGKGATMTNLTDFFLTETEKSPLDYDVVVVQISNNGHQLENVNVVLLPKISIDGVVQYFGATSQYYAYLRILCDVNGIKTRVVESNIWASKDLYVKKVTAIKF